MPMKRAQDEADDGLAHREEGGASSRNWSSDWSELRCTGSASGEGDVPDVRQLDGRSTGAPGRAARGSSRSRCPGCSSKRHGSPPSHLKCFPDEADDEEERDEREEPCERDLPKGGRQRPTTPSTPPLAVWTSACRRRHRGPMATAISRSSRVASGPGAGPLGRRRLGIRARCRPPPTAAGPCARLGQPVAPGLLPSRPAYRASSRARRARPCRRWSSAPSMISKPSAISASLMVSGGLQWMVLKRTKV